MALSAKHQVFIDEYLICLNASEAARRAGYNGKSNVVGPRLLATPKIRAEVDNKLANRSVGKDKIPARRMADKVYFIQAENGLIKIGISTDIQKRLSELNVASPIELKLLFCIQVNDARKLENSFHNVFRNKRVKGEWFRLSNEDLNWIKGNYGIES